MLIRCTKTQLLSPHRISSRYLLRSCQNSGDAWLAIPIISIIVARIFGPYRFLPEVCSRLRHRSRTIDSALARGSVPLESYLSGHLWQTQVTNGGGTTMGAILMQNSHLIVYFSKAFFPKLQKLQLMFANSMQLPSRFVNGTITFSVTHLQSSQTIEAWRISCPRWSKLQSNRLICLNCSGLITLFIINLDPAI